MKILKLVLTIIKNFFLIIYDELRKLLADYKAARYIFAALVILAVGYGGYSLYGKWKSDPTRPEMNLEEAAEVGQMTTHKLMVQIEPRKCPPEIASGCYERGDIVVIFPGDRDFSDGEKAGFLILNMDLTDKQAELLVRPIEKLSKEQPKDAKDAPPATQQVKIRRYTVDLKKIGVGDDVVSGKVLDGVFKWDVVNEKK